MNRYFRIKLSFYRSYDIHVHQRVSWFEYLLNKIGFKITFLKNKTL